MAIDITDKLKKLKAGQTLKLTYGEHVYMGCDTYDFESPKNRGVKLPDGVTILGHPSGQTRILCVRPHDSDLTVIHGGEGCIFTDLTIECSETTPLNNSWKRSGIRGEKGSIIENVKVIKCHGTFREMRECFGIVAVEGAVRNCEVTDIRGDYTSAIVGNLVEFNKVEWEFPVDDFTPFFRVAFNIGDTKDAILRYNTCKNAATAVYADYKICKGARIHDNIFNYVRNGIYLNAQTNPANNDVTGMENIEFFKNVVRHQKTGKEIAGFKLDHTNTKSDSKVINDRNYIRNFRATDNVLILENGHSVQYPYLLNVASQVKSKEVISADLGISNVWIGGLQCGANNQLVRVKKGLVKELFTERLEPTKWITSY